MRHKLKNGAILEIAANGRYTYVPSGSTIAKLDEISKKEERFNAPGESERRRIAHAKDRELTRFGNSPSGSKLIEQIFTRMTEKFENKTHG